MPDGCPDILDQSYALYLYLLFCVVSSTGPQNRLIFPSIRRLMTDPASSARQRKFSMDSVPESV